MKTRLAALIVFSCLLPAPAMAHLGHAAQGFPDGLTHPFMGLDHLLAMVAVGVWSVRHGQRIWLAPLLFMAMLAAGAMAGQHGLSLPFQESMVAASALLLGLMLAWPAHLSAQVSLAAIGVFAALHGLAHGSELTAGSSVLAGMLAGSAMLHGIGMLLAHTVLRRRADWVRALGGAVALAGGSLIVTSLM